MIERRATIIQPLVRILSQISSVHSLPPDFRKIHFSTVLQETPRSSEWSLHFRFLEEILYAF